VASLVQELQLWRNGGNLEKSEWVQSLDFVTATLEQSNASLEIRKEAVFEQREELENEILDLNIAMEKLRSELKISENQNQENINAITDLRKQLNEKESLVEHLNFEKTDLSMAIETLVMDKKDLEGELDRAMMKNADLTKILCNRSVNPLVHSQGTITDGDEYSSVISIDLALTIDARICRKR
jgi:chromosome segregation ATPase